MRVGFGEEAITPPDPRGHPLAGYIARKRLSRGVHDDIFIRVLLVEAEESLAVASLDLLAVDERMVEDLRRISRRVLGNVFTLVAATHTHSSLATLFSNPLLTYGSSVFREDYYEFFLERAERAFEQSSSTELAKLSLHATRVEGVGADRNHPGRPVDNTARILCFKTPTRRVLLVNYGVHPTVLGPENTYISSDLVGYAVRFVRERGGVDGVVFVNSAAANVSTRYTRRAQSFEEAERLGARLAEQVLKAISEEGEELSIESIRVEAHFFPVRYEDPRVKLLELLGSLPSLVARSRGRRARTLVESLRAILLLAGIQGRALTPGESRVEVDWVAVGNSLGILALPFEVHTDLAKRFESKAVLSGVKHFLLFSYANGYYGYLAPEDEVSYERLAQLVSSDSYRALLEGIERVLSRGALAGSE